jgi:hypothetical protein
MARNTRRTNLPPPWIRTDGGTSKTSAVYRHESGYWIEHCGHPTALWPYALYGPDGYMILAPNGRAWRDLHSAAAEVQRRLWKGKPAL